MNQSVRDTKEILIPTSEQDITQDKLAARPGSLNGKVLGLIDNHKTNANILMARVGELLAEKYHLAGVINLVKADGGHGAEESSLIELAKKCDIVVNGVGD